MHANAQKARALLGMDAFPLSKPPFEQGTLNELHLDIPPERDEDIQRDFGDLVKRMDDILSGELRIVIGILCTWDTVPVPFMRSYEDVIKPAGTRTVWATRGNIADMRNFLIKAALDADATHLWMLDADMVYPKEALWHLIKSNKDIIGGLACKRFPPHTPLHLQLPKDSPSVYMVKPSIPPYPPSVEEVAAIGGAGMLLSRFVLDTPSLRFRDDRFYEGTRVGEDIAFCADARAAGFHIYQDTRVGFGHITPCAVYWAPNTETGKWQLRYQAAGEEPADAVHP